MVLLPAAMNVAPYQAYELIDRVTCAFPVAGEFWLVSPRSFCFVFLSSAITTGYATLYDWFKSLNLPASDQQKVRFVFAAGWIGPSAYI